MYLTIEDILFSTEEATNLAHKYSTSSQHIRSIRRGKYIKEYIKAGNPLPVDLKDFYVSKIQSMYSK